eukprot:gene5200-7238_t
MSSSINTKSLYLTSYVDEGLPQLEHFKVVESTLNVNSLKEGEVIVQLLAISADPYIRGQIKSSGGLKVNEVISGFVSGKILVSKNPDWIEGDLLGSFLPFTTVQVIPSDKLVRTLTRKLSGLINESNVSHGIGVLGMPGATAYGGLIGVLQPKEGETIFISGAAGAVGGVVGMLAKKVFNCVVIGSCGGPEKCDFVKNTFGFDHVIDYKTANNAAELETLVKQVAPNGIDMYFDNVGGIHNEVAMNLLNKYGRVAICGAISQYLEKERAKLSIDVMKLIYLEQKVEGFLASSWLNGTKNNFKWLEEMHAWIGEGKIAIQETYFDGIEQWPVAFQSLFIGKNLGKVVVRV